MTFANKKGVCRHAAVHFAKPEASSLRESGSELLVFMY